jgi:tetrahydromethanopterin S-methyltransferase subunit A
MIQLSMELIMTLVENLPKELQRKIQNDVAVEMANRFSIEEINKIIEKAKIELDRSQFLYNNALLILVIKQNGQPK